MTTNAPYVLHAVEWEELGSITEPRPDGFSFHLSEADARTFVQTITNQDLSSISHITATFTRPRTYVTTIEVSQELHAHVVQFGDTWLSHADRGAYSTYKFPPSDVNQEGVYHA